MRASRFEGLDPERREAIVGASLEVFSEDDYAHASTAEIARRAGVSKSLLFFYFRNKRELYVYVLSLLTRRVAAAVVDERWYETDDFFELMRYAAERKAEAVLSRPQLMGFFVRAFYPSHRDVRGVLDDFMRDMVRQMTDAYLGHVRWDRFRDDVDPMRVVRMLVWLGDGYLHEQMRGGGDVDMRPMLDEFSAWLDMMRRASYREEFL